MMNVKKIIATTLAVTVLPLSVSSLGVTKVDAAYYGMPIVVSKKAVKLDFTKYDEAYNKAYNLVYGDSAGIYTLASRLHLEDEMKLEDIVRKSTSQTEVDKATENLNTAFNQKVSLFWAVEYYQKYNTAFSKDETGNWLNAIPEASFVMHEAYHGKQYRDEEWARILEAKSKVEELLANASNPNYDPTAKEVNDIATEFNKSISLWMTMTADGESWYPVGYSSFWDFMENY